jgi:L-ascorbate metabolism protein UlaG (beta-lactamase superfamily)
VPARQSVPENGYVLQGNSLTVYVAGDTLFDEPLFRQIAERYPHIDVALVPIGGIRVVGSQLDMTPDEAAQAFAILKPERVIPYHYELAGPFPFVTSATNPTKRFLTVVGAKAPGAVVVLAPGESWHHYR